MNSLDLIQKILSKQNPNGSWGKTGNSNYLDYLPKYKATISALITLAELGCDPENINAKKG